MWDVDQVVAELSKLRRRTFGQLPPKDLEAMLPNLTQIARYAFGSEMPLQPLRRLLGAAIKDLESDTLRRSSAELFGLTSQTFGRTLEHRQLMAAACFDPPPTVNTFRQRPQYSKLIIESVAERLCTMPPIVISAGINEESDGYIRRENLLAAALQLIGERRQEVLWIWGEPGSGKSTLAKQTIAALNLRGPAVTINCSNDRLLHGQLLKAVSNDDAIDARTWSEQACLEHFIRMAEDGTHFGLVLLEGLNDVRRLSQFLPATHAVPYMVTSRTRLDDPGVHPLQVHDYTPEESAVVIRTHLPGTDPEHVQVLAETVGHRPLVIDQVCRFLTCSPQTNIQELVEALCKDLAGGVDAVTSTNQQAELSLSAIYRKTMLALEDEGLAKEVLDCLLWMSRSGVLDGPLVDEFLEYRFTGASGRVGVAAAKLVLDRRGLIHWDDTVVISPLTLHILQSIRVESMTQQLAYFHKFLSNPSLTQCKRRMTMGVELRLSRKCFNDDEAKLLLCLDQDSWVMFHDVGDEPVNPVFYTISKWGIQKIVAGHAVGYTSDSEQHTLVKLTRLYFENVTRWYLGADSYVAPPDDTVSEADKYTHLTARGQGEANGQNILTAACGKRWRGTSKGVADKEVCPVCVNRGLLYLEELINGPVRESPEFLMKRIRRSLRESGVEQAALDLQMLEDDILINPRTAKRTLRKENPDTDAREEAFRQAAMIELELDVARGIEADQPKVAVNLYKILERRCQILLTWKAAHRAWISFAIATWARADLGLDSTEERIRLYRQSAIAHRFYFKYFPKKGEEEILAKGQADVLMKAAKLSENNDLVTAADLYDEAVSVMRKISTETSPAGRKHMAILIMSRGRAMTSSDPNEASECFREAADIFHELYLASGGNKGLHRSWISCLLNQADLAGVLAQEGADALYKTAEVEVRKLVKEGQPGPGHRSFLAYALLAQANLLKDKNPDGALPLFQEAYKEYEALFRAATVKVEFVVNLNYAWSWKTWLERVQQEASPPDVL